MRPLHDTLALAAPKISIEAKIHKLSGYSSHADQKGLVDFVKSMPTKPERIKLVHGDPRAPKGLKEMLMTRGYTVLK